MGCPGGAPLFCLAAAIVVAIVAAVVAIAAAAEQQDQDDDPAHITATETVVATKVTHKITSTFFDTAFDAAHSMVFRRAKLVRIFELSIFVEKFLTTTACQLSQNLLSYIL